MTPQEILLAAADLIEHTGWTQGQNARDINGRKCAPGSLRAICFCLEGSQVRIAPRSRRQREDARIMVHRELEQRGFARASWFWNDQTGRTKEEVVELMRAAAARTAQRTVPE